MKLSSLRFFLIFWLISVPLQALFFIIEGIISLMENLSYQILHLFWKTEYVRKGECQMTGQCCRAIGMELPRSWYRYPRLIHFVTKWHELRYHFTFLRRQDKLLVYECQYLKNNRCGIHLVKPKLCRDFPKTKLFGITKLHKGCGYQFVKRGGKSFEEVLRNQAHSISETDSK
jgi:Fe-S-cluster containining protein